VDLLESKEAEMMRVSRLMMVPAAAAGVMVLCSWVTAQELSRGGRSGAPRQGRPTYFALPGYPTLQSLTVQKELGLSEEQLAKLEEIGKKHREQMRQGYNREEWAKLSREERSKKYAELSEQRRKQADELRKQIEAVLTPKQLEALKLIELRRRAVYYLPIPRLAEELGLSDEQQQQLNKNRRELLEKIDQLQHESAKEALEILTPEQLEKLKKLHAEGYRTIRAPPQRPAKPR
jgi:Spy/CpxP family protein refolding chaperone